MLELVQKGLAEYLETKRVAFSRFYFLSNDLYIYIFIYVSVSISISIHIIHLYNLSPFQEANLMLELVQKGLAEYLETKRVAFSRFYFLSNDELLEILSQSKDPLAVQPHLKKCYEAIYKLTFEPVIYIYIYLYIYIYIYIYIGSTLEQTYSAAAS